MTRAKNETRPPAARLPRMLALTDDLAVQPRAIAAVKRSSLEDGKCTVYLRGQSATDGGFLLDMEFDEVLDLVNEALDPEED